MNAVVLVAISLWAFLASGMASYTAFIPAAFGLALAACAPGLKLGRRWAAYLTIAIGILRIRFSVRFGRSVFHIIHSRHNGLGPI